VLIVDDGAEARDLYCAYLEFHGFGTAAAEDGPSGIALALARTPAAIVLDFSMPRMDGAEVLRRLKADDRTRTIPVVMVTAVPELVARDARGSCAAFLEKPCEPDHLMQTIEDVVHGDPLRDWCPRAAPSSSNDVTTGFEPSRSFGRVAKKKNRSPGGSEG
jgi:CheY-like chemotaxis protein